VTTGRPTEPPTETSLLEILQDRAREEPERLVFCFLEDGETESERLTYADLDRRARAIASALQQLCAPGDRVLLVYPPGLEFIAALFGCFYAGTIAVPVYPPRFGVLDPLQPLARIAADCQPAALLVGGELTATVSSAAGAHPEFAALHVIETDHIHHEQHEDLTLATIDRDTPALLQYTSGSTGDPKGVVITHRNILANEFTIQLAFHHRTRFRPGTGVCWLPFYHDMGLIGNVLQAVYVDAPCYLMSPLVLLRHPIRWLEAISRYRAHSSGGPNFAYDLCVERITPEQKATLDLSCWELAAIGAEHVSADVIDRFSAAFAECGFQREVFFPCYGLAEATLLVSGGDKERPPVVRSFPIHKLEYAAEETAKPVEVQQRQETLVGCGHAWTTHEIAIVDPVMWRECLPGDIGEIWFRGPSVAHGYWGRAHETQETFHAILSDSGRGPFLRTGDLGFFDQGELFITGRLKDLIVIRGHNHYPQDIEDTVGRVHNGIRACAAFGCPVDGMEQLVVLVELDRRCRGLDLDALRREIRAHVSQEHQLHVREATFVRAGTLPRTTSGKLRRRECRQRYLQRQLTLWTGTPSE